MTKIRAAVVGYGNIGRFSVEALEAAPDFEIAGIVRRNVNNVPAEIAQYKVVADIRELGHVDVAILATPTREVEKHALECSHSASTPLTVSTFTPPLPIFAAPSAKLHARPDELP